MDQTEILAKIPANLITSMYIASISFFIATWLLAVLATRKVQLLILVFFIIWYILVLNFGRWQIFINPPFLPGIAIAFVSLFYLLKFLRQHPPLIGVVDQIPTHWLIAVQFFRVMGVGFLSFYALGLIPALFAIPTALGDIFIGLTAPFIAYGVKKRLPWANKWAIFWNRLGLVDLIMAISLGIATFPRPFQTLPTSPDNLPIALFPLVVVPCFAVPLSALIHVFAIRKLQKTGG